MVQIWGWESGLCQTIAILTQDTSLGILCQRVQLLLSRKALALLLFIFSNYIALLTTDAKSQSCVVILRGLYCCILVFITLRNATLPEHRGNKTKKKKWQAVSARTYRRLQLSQP
eukprot:2856647-Amphidinium_carterae.1